MGLFDYNYILWGFLLHQEWFTQCSTEGRNPNVAQAFWSFYQGEEAK